MILERFANVEKQAIGCAPTIGEKLFIRKSTFTFEMMGFPKDAIDYRMLEFGLTIFNEDALLGQSANSCSRV